MSATALAEVGWDGGFVIPVANAANKALEEELQRKEKETIKVENELERKKDKSQALSDHLKNAIQELSHTQGLCKAKEREATSEKHFKALSEREAGRLRQEQARVRSQLGVLREKRNSQENDIFKASQKLEKLRSRLNWDQQTLDAWLEESALRDEDTMALVKYSQQDERRIKSLTLAIEKKMLEANQKRKALDNELTETLSAQIGLEKTAENFRQAHQERQELLRQWENTIKQMKKRDAEMQQSAAVREKNGFLQIEEQNNQECDRRISRAERQASKLRQDFQEHELNRSRLQDELDSVKATVDRTATDVKSLRTQISSVKRDIQDKTDKVNDAQLHTAALEDKLRAVTQTALSVEERAAQFDQLLRDEEQATKELDMQLQHHREVLFRQKQNLQALRTKEKDLTAQMLGCKAALSSLHGHMGKLEQNLLKQQEIIYNQDLQIQQLESKVGRLLGEVDMEEKQALEPKTTQLMSTVEESSRAAQLLSTQLKELDDDIRRVRKEAERTGAENRELTTKMEELQLSLFSKAWTLLVSPHQDAMVEDNMLKLELRRLRDLLYNKADGVLSQEKRRLELQTAMREREAEIRFHREMLSKEMKIAQQERQELSAEVHERLSKIDKMRKRYEVLIISMATPEGEEDKSQAYYVIKVAQEKEELRRKGDNLDAKIRKMETEIRALDNTIQLINNCNTSYRKSFHKVPESSPEKEEKVRLEEQQRAVEEKHRYRRRQIRELQEDIQGMSRTMEMLGQEDRIERERTEDAQSRMAQLNKEVDSQNEKLSRVTKQCSKLTREIRSANKSAAGRSFEERDIELREMRDFNRTVNRMLLEVVEEQPHLQASIQEYFLQANLPLPTPSSTPASRQSSNTSSARSSLSLR
ncbi:Coiled-coil domain-containing protein 39 [Merluccius polli]|uniref:Coiled-coil domain-containing protein 39 n=1 Tax=Merluccius polli TaxID=89951 RepID=A0AA47M0E4_MERPO|nr:Coiled-coil domain-containing protein 39 [Merluccius polli]